MAAGWSTDCTKALLSLWGEQNIQNQLDGAVRNRIIYEKLAERLRELGYEFTGKQCRTKVKNLTQTYRKVKDSNRRSGKGRAGCPFFEELDAILGSRAASEPALLLESASGSCSRQEAGADDSPTSHPGISSSPSPEVTGDCSLTNCDTSCDSEERAGETTDPSNVSASTNTPQSSSSNSVQLGKRKGKKRKESFEFNFLDKLAQIEEMAEKREEKREQRHLELEAKMEDQRRQKEQQHEERMMSLFLSLFGQMAPSFPPGHGYPTSYPPYFPQPPFQTTSLNPRIDDMQNETLHVQPPSPAERDD